MSPLGKRSTPDLVVILLTACVVFVIVFSLIGAVVLRIADSNADLSGIAKSIASITNTLIGAVVGYLAGRGVVPSSAVPPSTARPQQGDDES